MKTASRLDGLDTLRGLTLVSMICYHACWDMVWMFGADWAWYRSRGAFLWQQSICWTFILLSGYCYRLGKHPFRRGGIVFAAGALVSAVTILFLPENRVFFGILSLLGASMLLTALLQAYLSRVPAPLGLSAAFALFLLCYRIPDGALPAVLYGNDFTACFGFPPRDFFSTDYFPLLPWLFLFWCGFWLHDVTGAFLSPPSGGRCRRKATEGGKHPTRRVSPQGDRSEKTPPPGADAPPSPFWGGQGTLDSINGNLLSVRLPLLTALGRHSLWVYLLHQPVIYALLSLTVHGEIR